MSRMYPLSPVFRHFPDPIKFLLLMHLSLFSLPTAKNTVIVCKQIIFFHCILPPNDVLFRNHSPNPMPMLLTISENPHINSYLIYHILSVKSRVLKSLAHLLNITHLNHVSPRGHFPTSCIPACISSYLQGP